METIKKIIFYVLEKQFISLVDSGSNSFKHGISSSDAPFSTTADNSTILLILSLQSHFLPSQKYLDEGTTTDHVENPCPKAGSTKHI